jgi:hypothetical protein
MPSKGSAPVVVLAWLDVSRCGFGGASATAATEGYGKMVTKEVPVVAGAGISIRWHLRLEEALSGMESTMNHSGVWG